jgi:radical SAM superfamily enzyme YgiQ (UPF0313 family)
MSNLGFQAVYSLINSIDRAVCERAFLPDDAETATGRITTIESDRPLVDFDIIALSISFENDYPNLLTIFDKAGLPLRSDDRGPPFPLVLAGGVACFLNPEPIAPFIDAFLIGEAEVMLTRLIESFDPDMDRSIALRTLARGLPGFYVPRFYEAVYDPGGALARFSPSDGVPDKIRRVYVEDLSKVSTCTTILTPDTIFDHTYLIEVARGCGHGCRFCSAGYIYRPPRFRPPDLLESSAARGVSLTDTIGLLGAAVSDLPDIGQFCEALNRQGARVSFSSLRADALSPEIVSALRSSRTKTATIAPDAGSRRMRDVINKGISEDAILYAAETLVENGIPNLKLYFMIGLPTETMKDVEAITALCKKIKHRFLRSSRIRKRIGTITVSLNCFVPKPFTPFQWSAMDDIKTLKRKIRKIKDGLKKVANVRVHADVPRWAYIQALFSRGDRRVADMLELAHHNHGNWAKTLKASPVNPDYYVLRERSPDELFPWDFIDHGIFKSFLWKEYENALEGKSSPPCPAGGPPKDSTKDMIEACTRCGVCGR